MLRVRLSTYGDAYVTSVLVLPMNPMPDAIMWGSRKFFRRTYGDYVEGLMVAAWTEEEYAAQGRAIHPDALIEDYVPQDVSRHVVINGTKRKASGTVTYVQVVQWAGMTGTPSVTFSKALFGREGILSPGQSIDVVDGTIFNCVHTGAA